MGEVLKVFEMFAGYGGASFALKKVEIDFECVGYSEIDKYAIQCFEQNHKGKNYGDCRNINPKELPDFDLLTGGFPCQSFSVAGKRKGEADPRGTLFYEIIRIAEVKKPKYMLLENVKGLTFKNHKDTFNKILSELDRIGYNVHWKVLNSKDYGIPQSRQRVWFVCIRKDLNQKFEFPKEEELKIFVKDILEDEVDKKYYLSKEHIKKFEEHPRFKIHDNDDKPFWTITSAHLGGWDDYRIRVFDKATNKETEPFFWVNKENDKSRPSYLQFQNGNHSEAHRYYNPNGIIQTMKGNLKIICASRKTQRNIPKEERTIDGQQLEPKLDGTSNTISTIQKDNYLLSDKTIRRLTPKECFRLMGFLNDEINLEGLSDTQKYKLAGNGWEINIASKILHQMCSSENKSTKEKCA